MPASQVHAVVRTLSLALVALALLAPAASAQGTMAANDDSIKAAPTGVRDVLADDTGSTAAIRVVSNSAPAHGSATCSALGACFYKANSGFTGSDSFTYTARDAAGSEDTATVSVTVVEGTKSDAVLARDDEVATLVNKAATVRPLENDTGSGVTLKVDAQPKHGTVACDAGAVCTYTPAPGYVGSDGFPYTISRNLAAKRTAHGESGGPSGGSGSSSAAVHVLVAPADTGYNVGLTGGPDPVAQGGQANWSLGVLGVPEGISGQELRAQPLPSASTGAPSGPHSLQSVKTAKGWTSSSGADGSVVATAGNGALLGESVSQTFPRPLPPIRQGTGGDGHVPILVGSKVFAFYHHTDPTSVTCVDRNTGALCPGYEPRGIRLDFPDGDGFGTTDINGPGIVSGSKIWTHLEIANSFAQSAPIGLFCWDTATNSTCGLTIVDRIAGNEDPGASAPVLANGKMWFGGDTDKLYCVDPTDGATCGSHDMGIGTFQGDGRYDSLTHGNRVYVSRRADKVTCIDVAAGARCDGWSPAKSFDGRWNLVNQHDASGATIGVCVFAQTNGKCVTDAGATSDITNFVHTDVYAESYGYSVTQEAETGKRTLVASLQRGGLGCYDWSTMAPCTGGDYGADGWITQEANGGQGLPSAYGATFDGSCVIALGDPGQVYTVDPAGSSPCLSLGTGTDKLTIDLHDQRCDGTVGAARYRTVTLSDADASEMESVFVTVRDTVNGAVVSGELIGGKTLDISSIDPSHPITVDATAKGKNGNSAWNDGIPPRIRVSWKSDPQSACVVTKGDGGCGDGNAALALVGSLRSPYSGSKEARLTMNRAACAGGVKGETARKCGGRRLFKINIRYKGKDIRKLTVKVKGKKQKVLRMKPRPRVRIDLRKYRKGRVVVQITIVTKAGKKLTGTRVYHPCTKKRPGRGFKY